MENATETLSNLLTLTRERTDIRIKPVNININNNSINIDSKFFFYQLLLDGQKQIASVFCKIIDAVNALVIYHYATRVCNKNNNNNSLRMMTKIVNIRKVMLTSTVKLDQC